MGIDYVLDLDCTAKQALTTNRIIELHKVRNRAQWVLENARENGDMRSPSEIPFTVELDRRGSVGRSDATVQSMLDQAAPLDQHLPACTSCSANRKNPKGYGCYRFINYPIEGDTEELLLSRLPDDLASASGRVFARYLQDSEWDGTAAATMRRENETFFRLRSAPSRTWAGMTINADQVFQMMFQVGNLHAGQAMRLAQFFGLLADNLRPVDRTPERKPTSAHAKQMFVFLKTLGFAAVNNVDVIIDA